LAPILILDNPPLTRLRRRGAAFFAAATLAAAIFTAQTSMTRAAEPPLAGLSPILGELRKGGFVIFFRHAMTEQLETSDAIADLTRCETQRNLSPAGRAQAAEMGKAIKALGVPVGTVAASPFCRTRDTAQIAFGRVTVNPRLYFAIGTDAAETSRLADSLRQLLATPPAPGTNTMLVSHSVNLREAVGIFAKPEGAAYVFRPLPDGRSDLVAKILPEEWSRAAKSGRSGSMPAP
jgi:phosphohistidine phosphatase SixA